MRKYLILSFFFLLPFSSFAQENNYFLMLKNKKVNVRYGPSFDYPIKYVYRKIELPLKVIDKKDSDLTTIKLIEFNNLVQNDKRVETMILPIRDGLSICRKN